MFDGIDGAFDGREGRHDDHPQVGLTLEQLWEEIHPSLRSEPEIEKHHIEVSTIERLQRGLAGGNTEHTRASGLEAQSQ